MIAAAQTAIMLQCTHNPIPGHGTTHSKWWYLNSISGSRYRHVGQSARLLILLKSSSAPKPMRKTASELASTDLNNDWKNEFMTLRLGKTFLVVANGADAKVPASKRLTH